MARESFGPGASDDMGLRIPSQSHDTHAGADPLHMILTLESVNAGKSDIHEDYVGIEVFCLSEAFFARVNRNSFMPPAMQQHHGAVGDVMVVVDHPYLAGIRRHVAPPRPLTAAGGNTTNRRPPNAKETLPTKSVPCGATECSARTSAAQFFRGRLDASAHRSQKQERTVW